MNVALRGNDLTALQRAADLIETRLKTIRGVSDVKSSLADADPAVNIEVKRDAAATLGIDLNRVGQTLSTMLAGSLVTTWEAPDGENYDVRLQVPKNLRHSELLDVLTVAGNRSPNGQALMIPLSTVTQLSAGINPRQIDRVDLQREISVSANIFGRDAGSVFADIDAMTAKLQLPQGISIDQQGDRQDMQESLSFALQALAMGLIFIYMRQITADARQRRFDRPHNVVVFNHFVRAVIAHGQ